MFRNWVIETNNMKLSKHKCHVSISGDTDEHIWTNMGDEKTWENAIEKSLGMEIGRDLNFDDHVPSLSEKKGRKLAVLAR